MKEILAVASMVAVSLSAAADEFILDIDDASHVKLETGNYSPYDEVPLENGENVIQVYGMEDFLLTPQPGWLIESITAYDENGNVDPDAKEWQYYPKDDHYQVWFYNNMPYRYEVKTKVNNVKMNTFTLTIDNPDAVLDGYYKVGNQNVTPESGTKIIEYDPAKGDKFYMELRPAVTSVTFLRNGVDTEPYDVMDDGTRIYSFKLEAEEETVEITTEMEEKFFFLDIDDPAHVNVFYPDKNTPLENLEPGKTRLEFAYDATLYVSAKEGYRIVGFENMDFISKTDVYMHQFVDGDSGVEFSCTTEEYTIPTCKFIVNVDDSGYVVTANGGLYDNREPGEPIFDPGDNEYVINLDKVKSITFEYSYRFDDLLIGSYNGKAFQIDGPEDMWSDSTTTFTDFEEGETYRVVIRKRIEGSYNKTGEVTSTTSDDKLEWTISFDPAGVIELVDGVELPAIIPADVDEASAYADGLQNDPEIELGENDVTIRFANPLEGGDYKLVIPSGLFKVNNALVGELTYEFSVVGSGISSITPDNDGNTEYFTLQGVKVTNPQSGELLIVRRGADVSKEVVK